MNNFHNKIVVVTGASRGIGRALARSLAKRSAKVFISGRTKKDLDSLAREIGAISSIADVTREKDLVRLARLVIRKAGGIDVWINNAGIWLPHTPVERIDPNRAHKLFEVNLFGVFYGCRAVIPYFKERGSGIILNIISTSALSARPNQTIYAASKWAARGFTESLREELRNTGIKVIAVYPGGTKTNLFDESSPEEFDLFMSPVEVAEKIISNIEKDEPDFEQVLKRPGQG